jgi:peptide/nickel transport system substrate-binding protein
MLGQRITRRRALGVGAGITGAAAFALACGGGGGTKEAANTAPQPQASVAAGQSEPQQAGPKQGGQVRVRFTGTPPLDPFANTTFRAQTLAGYTYSRLLKFRTGEDPAVASNYEVVPDLAAAWEIAGDGTQLTFKLQPNATYHAKPPLNGRAVDAEDVKFAFERFRSEPKNSNRSAFGTPETPIVEKLETPDPKTVVVKLAKPYGPILNLFANPQYLWILPKESAGGFDPAKDQIGSGPWVFESLQPDQEVKLKANRAYFDKGKPYADTVSIPIIGETVQGKAQFQAEKLDIEAINFEDKPEVERSNPKARYITYTPTTTPFLAFQLRGTSPFRDERLRRAFSMAFDRNALLQLSYDGKGWLHNFVPANLGKWWLDPKSADAGESARYYKHDLREARQLVQAAGASGMQFKFIYTNNAYGERFNQWAETVATMLKDIGVSPQIVVQDYAREYIAAGGTFFGGFEGVFFGLQTPFTDPHDFLFNMNHSQSKRNHAGVNDPALDALIDKEAATLDENTRVRLVREIQKYLSDKMYYAPGFVGPAFTGVQPWVKGYRYSATYGSGTESVAELWIDRA